MAEIYVTSTADSGAGSLRQAIADAQDGDVILFDADVFPAGQTTSILLSSYLVINKNVSIYGGVSDGEGGYTSGATITWYVIREVEGVETEVVVDEEHPAQEGEVVLMHVHTRVALDGQAAQDSNHTDDFDGWTGSRILYVANRMNVDVETTISGLTFQNGLCTASEYSAVWALSTTSNELRARFEDCKIANCINSSGYAGSITLRSLNEANYTFTRCEFCDCKAKTNAGGIYVRDNTIVTFCSCVITNCYAAGNGGGAYLRATSQCTLDGCVISGCSADGYGGGIELADSCVGTLNNCRIINCNSVNNGAGVYIVGNSSSLFVSTGCIFKGCNSKGQGGGVYANTPSQCAFDDCTITDCSAASGGGAFYSGATTQNVLNGCTITGCSASSGGGIYFTSSSQNTLNDCIIINCNATSSGGALRLETASINFLNSCVIKNCSATINGGGIYAAGTTQNTVNNCSISNCASAQNTGGVALYNANGTNVVNNCVISDNIGGEASRNDLVVAVTNGTIIKSSVIGSLRLAYTTTVTISDNITTVNSIFFGANTSGVTSSIVIDDGVALTITNSASVGSGSISSDGRGYLAVAPGINVSEVTLTNVVLCAYGADVSSFSEVDGVLEWEAANPTTTVLIERADGDSWTTVTQTAGESLTLYLPPSDTVRLFDGVQFFTATAPSQRTYYYIGGSEGSFISAADWSLRRGGTAITEPPVVAGQRFIVGDISSGE